AGYSAAMVALLDTPHPDQILTLGLDRFLTVMIGVVVAVLVGLVFTPQAAEGELAGRIRRLSARCLRDFAARLR
ncbi:FUSC family protein, partial [Vibrio parahaemolyticus]